ncbi:MAG: hypothetical protein H6849_04340 [Alphaproteobacteria bacterium]|nr:MAG: hypothetical protein H6849_04340 [Alphaproteobacteria bacterium]
MIHKGQYTLSFRENDSYALSDYCITERNQFIWHTLQNTQEWSSHCVYLRASRGGGKTHLANIFTDTHHGTLYSGADLTSLPSIDTSAYVCIDNVERVRDPEVLFHMYNKIKEMNARLLVTSTTSVADFPHLLPDLLSRLRSSHIITMPEPDEILMRGILLKRFADMQWHVKAEVLDYVIVRINRTYEAIDQIISALTFCVEEQHRNITLPVIRSVLEDIKRA